MYQNVSRDYLLLQDNYFYLNLFIMMLRINYTEHIFSL